MRKYRRCILAVGCVTALLAARWGVPWVLEYEPAHVLQERGRLRGTWTLVAIIAEGKQVTGAGSAGRAFGFDGDLTYELGPIGPDDIWHYAPDPTSNPKRITLVGTGDFDGTVIYGVYEMDGDDLRICTSPASTTGQGVAPASLTSDAATRTWVRHFRRVAAEPPSPARPTLPPSAMMMGLRRLWDRILVGP
jgi:uncharacterized protein (TIGR03067 family)